jgi:translation initiation factor IF-2
MISPEGSSGSGDKRKVRISMPITVRSFAELTELAPFRVIADLMELGVFASMSHSMSESNVCSVGKKNGVEIEIVSG